ncbi:MAG: hypothetical protein RLY14_2842, partial [Planctomycetota bacterium]
KLLNPGTGRWMQPLCARVGGTDLEQSERLN